MIRLRHEALPSGLSALVRRRADGDLIIIVSTALSTRRQRAAVRAGLRAIQPARRRAGGLPVLALMALALAGAWLRALGRLLRVHPVATAAVAATATAAAVVVAVAPHVHGPAVAGQKPPSVVQQPGPTISPSVPGRVTPSASAVARAQPQPSVVPVTARSPGGATATSAPAVSQPHPASSSSTPAPGPSTPAPTPTPTPTGTGKGGGSGICLDVLGIWVCL